MLRVVLARKWLILVVTAVVSTLVTLWTLERPKIYEATTVLEFDPNPPTPLGRDVQDVGDPIGGYWTAREFFKTQYRVIASRGVAQRVGERLGLHEDPDFWDVDGADEEFEPRSLRRTARALQRRLKVAPEKETRLVRLHVRDRSPERARAIADAFADAYVEKTLEDRMGSTVNALEWLGEQLDQLRSEVERSELALHEFKEEHNVLSVSMEDRQNLVASEIESFSLALTDAQKRRIEMSARVARLQAALSDDALESSGTVFDERSAVTSLRGQMREKLAERERLSSRLGDSHPEMRALAEEVESLERQIAAEVAIVVANAEADLREVRAVEQGLRSSLESAHAAGLDLNLREIEYQRLNRERQSKTKLYEMVLQRTTETDLTRMLQTSFVRLVDRAERPAVPVSPNVEANITGGVIGGLVLGILLAFGLSLLDRRLRSPEEVEELGVTVLGVIPLVGEDVKKKRNASKRPGARDEDVRNPALVVSEAPTSMAAECIRTVRTNLTFMSVGEDRAQALVVTSSQPREGKTTVASNLAASIATSGKTVVLLDTDLRKPRVHKAFGISAARGVSSVVVGQSTIDEAIQQSGVPGLDLVPAGPVPPNPAELLHSRRFDELVAAMRSRYDVVIFDSPPLGVVTDAAVIAPQLDGVIVVTKWGVTTRDALRATVRQLETVGARILGAVVNHLDASREGYYGKGYYYSAYGEYYGEEPDPTETETASAAE
ncbi:MAG: polysaccharide biosynthesis tyrosine autokinase [Myxococcota bacterium]